MIILSHDYAIYIWRITFDITSFLNVCIYIHKNRWYT